MSTVAEIQPSTIVKPSSSSLERDLRKFLEANVGSTVNFTVIAAVRGKINPVDDEGVTIEVSRGLIYKIDFEQVVSYCLQAYAAKGQHLTVEATSEFWKDHAGEMVTLQYRKELRSHTIVHVGPSMVSLQSGGETLMVAQDRIVHYFRTSH